MGILGGRGLGDIPGGEFGMEIRSAFPKLGGLTHNLGGFGIYTCPLKRWWGDLGKGGRSYLRWFVSVVPGGGAPPHLPRVG